MTLTNTCPHCGVTITEPPPPFYRAGAHPTRARQFERHRDACARRSPEEREKAKKKIRGLVGLVEL